jgi:TonB family protein
MMGRLSGSMVLSALLHAGTFAAALGYIAWSDAHPGMVSIDLGASSLLLRAEPPKDAGKLRPVAPPKLWLLAAPGRPAPVPTPPPVGLTVTPESEAAGPPCPPPCPDNPGDWAPAANLSLKPVWSDGMITEGDYPVEMRRSHKEGVVVVDVLIDARGAVRGVRLVQGDEPAFNNLVLERMIHSNFNPARDRDGHAVPCRARIPIRFQLQ